ncbi:hypothetical protein WKH56_20505 [Priestia sp. SB1]
MNNLKEPIFKNINGELVSVNWKTLNESGILSKEELSIFHLLLDKISDNQ